jgi:hypothetical protein
VPSLTVLGVRWRTPCQRSNSTTQRLYYRNRSVCISRRPSRPDRRESCAWSSRHVTMSRLTCVARGFSLRRGRGCISVSTGAQRGTASLRCFWDRAAPGHPDAGGCCRRARVAHRKSWDRGEFFNVQDFPFPGVIPAFHPASALRMPSLW